MYKTVSGLDVHKDSIFCCILCTDGRKIQHKFGTLTEKIEYLTTNHHIRTRTLLK